jgi:hypothetical protein
VAHTNARGIDLLRNDEKFMTQIYEGGAMPTGGASSGLRY